MTLRGHTDSITGLALSADGSHLLSNSMDNLLRAWDVRPYCATPDRCVKIFQGVVVRCVSVLCVWLCGCVWLCVWCVCMEVHVNLLRECVTV